MGFASIWLRKCLFSPETKNMLSYADMPLLCRIFSAYLRKADWSCPVG